MSKELWDIQARFTEKALRGIDKDLSEFTEEDKVKWTKEYLLYISKEGLEALDELNWKKHSKEYKEVNVHNVKVELIDMQKFLWGLMHIWGMTYGEFETIFKDKSYEVENKWVQNFELKGVNENLKNCIIDIDGVLNNYPDCFFDWVFKEHNISKDELVLNMVKYETYKDLYRISGAKRNLPVNEDSVKALHSLKDEGYSIILMTNRPSIEYKNIIFDTMFWLADNDIPYDYLYWSRNNKIVDAFKQTDNISFIVDDSFEVCRDFENMGIKSYVLSQDSNLHLTNKISSMLDIEELKE
tara:strand:- start:6956 stop:7849 length:894 start_codon:yes stop_codon:yes gene_type:complete